jgi:hypothetical protein
MNDAENEYSWIHVVGYLAKAVGLLVVSRGCFTVAGLPETGEGYSTIFAGAGVLSVTYYFLSILAGCNEAFELIKEMIDNRGGGE